MYSVPPPPEEGKAKQPQVLLQVSSDGEYIDLEPATIAKRHRLVAFELDDFVESPDGRLTACDTLASYHAGDATDAESGHEDMEGSLHVVPPLRLSSSGFSIACWVRLPVKRTGTFHALAGDGRGNAFAAIDEKGTTLGVISEPRVRVAKRVCRPSAPGFAPFIPSAALVHKKERGWHHLVAVGDGQITFFYVNGRHLGAAPACCRGPIAVIGNANLKQYRKPQTRRGPPSKGSSSEDEGNSGQCKMPFGAFYNFQVYRHPMFPKQVEALYQEQRKLHRLKHLTS
ncbi:hypothetical protein cyc_07991 [Cyclospora cayetanensis]|uniref:LamG-like jellyroll fold domain-containing protein n=1 Tax=Cyclospora cayetanensis TaxID=88456 RepID=A0A1D3D1K1_9EIME|nr:hypothetical protein cyc_07991 [Cyclospora cayetanensis]